MSLKISEFPAATSILGTDLLNIVQNYLNKKITVSDFFSNIPVALGTSKYLKFTGTPEIVTNGVISNQTPISHLDLANVGNSVLSLAAGEEGQVKVLVAISNGTSVLSTGIRHTSITFSHIGATATMVFTGGLWTVIGGTCTVV